MRKWTSLETLIYAQAIDSLEEVIQIIALQQSQLRSGLFLIDQMYSSPFPKFPLGQTNQNQAIVAWVAFLQSPT